MPRKLWNWGLWLISQSRFLKNEVIEKVSLAVKRLKERENREMGKEKRNVSEISAKEHSQEQPAAIDQIKRYMQAHVDSDYSLMDVADYMQMNPAYLSRYLKKKPMKHLWNMIKS